MNDLNLILAACMALDESMIPADQDLSNANSNMEVISKYQTLDMPQHLSLSEKIVF